MKEEFIDYLYKEGSITQEQKELLLKQCDDVTVNDDLLTGHFQLLDMDRIVKPVWQCVQLIIDLDIMSIEELEERLLSYDLDKQLESFAASILGGEEESISTDVFINAFENGFLLTALELSDHSPMKGRREMASCFYCDHLFYQTLEGDQKFFIGLTADMNVFTNIAEGFYEKLMPSSYKGTFSGEQEDVKDTMLEFLNNVNSTSTYNSNPGFDLNVPEYVEDIFVYSEEIHRLYFSLDGNVFAFIIIPSWEYHFEHRGV